MPLSRPTGIAQRAGQEFVIGGVSTSGWQPGRAVPLDGEWEVKGQRVVEGEQRWEFVRKSK